MSERFTPAAARTTGAPMVSVVVATYNMAGYLPLAVRSILAQSYEAVQVCIVDDGSQDDTPAITAQLAAEPRVHVVRQSHSGQARAKNRGIEEAAGQFVAFLDADDLWRPDKLARQLPLFHNDKVAVVYSDYECIDAEGRVTFKRPTIMHRGRVSAQLLVENFVCFPSVVVRREIVQKAGGFDESLSMGIDYDLWLRLSVHHEFDYLPESTVQYRVWEGQMSKNFRLRFDTAERIMRRFIVANPDLVDPGTVAEAYAHTFTAKGNAAIAHGERAEGRRAFYTALRYKPIYVPAWRSLIRSLL